MAKVGTGHYRTEESPQPLGLDNGERLEQWENGMATYVESQTSSMTKTMPHPMIIRAA
jgi:hypothetical protein